MPVVIMNKTALMISIVGLVGFLFLLGGQGLAQNNSKGSDDEVRQRIVQKSMASYPGKCPCPYSRTSNGSRCGGRSAYSRPGGASPICYPAEVSADMIRRYRERN
jgi:hypothetical protein